MPLRTPQEYLDSLRDGRRVYYRGRLVEDVTAHAVIGLAARHAAIDYELAEDPAYRELATVDDRSRYFAAPREAGDLLERSRLIETATRLGGTLVVLIKEIGSDALFALSIVAAQVDRRLGTAYGERVAAFHRRCAAEDLALAVAQTDVKGDRSLGPAEQAARGHPDAYLRIVERRPDGIVVRGAKAHTSVSTNANEIIVLPTRAMSEADADYAVAFAVPANCPGLTMIASPHGGSAAVGNAFEHPISSRHKMMETLTIFDDVFVPNERVFLAGEWAFAGPLALTFVEFHRFTAVSYKLPLVDALAGTALLLAEYNGIERAGHVRDKLAWLVAYAEGLRALTHMAAHRCRADEATGIAVPDPLTVNVAKLHFATNYHQAVARVQDIAGGLLVTGPSEEDLRAAELGPAVRRYLRGKLDVEAEARLRALNLAADLTASDFGGYQEVLAIHAEGSIEAEKLTILRHYDSAAAKAYARQLAGID
ncbi:MAG TPA: 4-hydroxyphenylacetate 3-hydroxylase N-terminal domain-containing protein [Chloroflexota bacterium]|jgi:4-hydroxybutyryl-CoA dehydratase/vinylacetyl-CoA-Delta-isomerase|nr:4-hydroxyphenylacetate 3-hydroxylase N-terminal domain-containing protein [Chloroflexota bacterium]